MVADIRKVALLMSCLPRSVAESLIERLPEEHGESLRHDLDELSDVDPIERERVMREFLTSFNPSRRRRYRIDAGQPLPPSFHFLVPVPPAKIVELLADELLQTQAVVLSQLPSAVSDEVLELMSEERRSQVAGRLACLEPIPQTAMQDIADVCGILFDEP